MNLKGLFLLISLAVMPGLQCAGGGVSSSASGVFISEDTGQTWETSNVIVQDGNSSSLGRFDIAALKLDPKDDAILYAATRQAGLYRSEDGGQNWSSLTTTGNIQSVTISPINTSHLAAARDNQVFISADDGLVWQLVYTDPGQALITDVHFDTEKEQTLYLTTSGGQMLKSVDLGLTWSLARAFDRPIRKLRIHPEISSILYVITEQPEIWQSKDGGATWTALGSLLRQAGSFTSIKDALIHPKNEQAVLVSTDTGLFLSLSGGDDWRRLPLVSSGELQISAIGWDPIVVNVLYYATPSVFYRSEDGGASWRTSLFSSRRPPRDIIIDNQNRDRIYLGTSH